jgi:putative transposase
MGIAKLVHLSNGFQIENPNFSTPKKAKCSLKNQQRQVTPKAKGSKNPKKAAKPVDLFHQKISEKCQAYPWEVANKIASCQIDCSVLENLNISGMMRRCRTKFSKKTGIFLKNGQSPKKGLNSSIVSDAGWGKWILKINYLAAKQGKIVIKVIPKHSTQKCRNYDNIIDNYNRDSEKFICLECGYPEHTNLATAKTIRDRALELVRGDSVKSGVLQHLRAQKISPRSKLWW